MVMQSAHHASTSESFIIRRHARCVHVSAGGFALNNTELIYAGDVLDEASAWVGYQETNDNITSFAKAFFPEFQGSPWCAMFVASVLINSGFDLKGELEKAYNQDQTSIDKKIVYTPTFHDALRKLGWQEVSPEQARAGDIVFMDVDSHNNRSIDHVGLCSGNTGSSLKNIEGNTSDGSDPSRQREGYTVARKIRPYRMVTSVIRPIYPLENRMSLSLDTPVPLGDAGTFPLGTLLRYMALPGGVIPATRFDRLQAAVEQLQNDIEAISRAVALLNPPHSAAGVAVKK
jgi:hypothetical protein